MKLTRYTDYALRALMYLGLHGDRLCSIAEVARANRISENHLTKVVHELGRRKYVTTLRGRNGGLRLGRPPEAISVGEVVRAVEEGFELLDCPGCHLVRACLLTNAFSEALSAFLKVLDGYTIADLIGPRDPLLTLLSTMANAPEPVADGG